MGNIQFYDSGSGYKILFTVNGIAMNSACCCDLAPDECPEGLGECYQLVDYSDHDLAACDTCLAAGNGTPWDGVFDAYVSEGPIGPCYWGPSTVTPTIDGKKGLPLTFVKLDAANSKWVMSIGCLVELPPLVETCLIWQGEKLTGQTPVGTYTRTDGNDETATLEVEACP